MECPIKSGQGPELFLASAAEKTPQAEAELTLFG